MVKISTRGNIGFRYKEKDYLTYNHFDSYPSGVGKDILEECKQVKDWEQVKKFVETIRFVEQDDKPTKEDLEKYSSYGNPSVGGSMSNTEITQYYQLLRDIQGTLKPYLNNEIDIINESNEFILDSLFCEWAYIINLDTMKLEVYEGFQQSPQKGNRYGEEANEVGYYPCKLVKEYDLNKLPSEKKFVNDLEPEEE